jgi:hypothetical protein
VQYGRYLGGRSLPHIRLRRERGDTLHCYRLPISLTPLSLFLLLLFLIFTETAFHSRVGGYC